jgi:hypothetical protein
VALAGQPFANPEEITLATEAATCQLNARAAPGYGDAHDHDHASDDASAPIAFLSNPHRQARRQPGYSTLPGFMTPVGSSTRLIARITSVASPSSLTR